MKSVIKSVFEIRSIANIQTIINKIKPYSHISFDIFDTLIKRDVAKPSDVFTLTQLTFKKRTGKSIENWKQIRIRAESDAWNNRKRGEITLDEIYEALPEEISNEERILLLNIETETELAVCAVNKTMLPVYEWCRQNGKTLIFTSDMYLPVETIKKILIKAGLEKGTLFLSSSIGIKKYTGDLFIYILRELNISKRDIIHVGDNYEADCRGSKKAGIRSVLVSRSFSPLQKRCLYDCEKNDKFSYDCFRALQANRFPYDNSLYCKWGYENFGLLLYSFCSWLHDDLEQRGIENIVFFSRDGFIIKKAYDLMYPDANTQYLYVSRRSLRVPQIWMNPSVDEIYKILSITSKYTVRVFFNDLGLEWKDYISILDEFSLGPDNAMCRSDVLNKNEIKRLFQRLLPDIIENSKKEFDLLINYLKQLCIIGDIAVVDIGWRGSLQLYLHKLIEQAKLNINMHGYYVALLPDAHAGIDMQGYLKSIVQEDDHSSIFKFSISLYETLFFAQEGSVYRYIMRNNTIIPELYPYEYELEGEIKWEGISVKEIQEGALCLIRDIMNSALNNLQIGPKTSFSNLRLAAEKPDNIDLQLFADFSFFDVEDRYFAKPLPLYRYMISPRKLYSDFWFSCWKIGFMKKLFKMPLPYAWIFRTLKGIRRIIKRIIKRKNN